MNNFGFNISQTRGIDYDKIDTTPVENLLAAVPSYRACIGCGGCTATCSAAGFVPFDIRRIHTAFSRGRYEGLSEQLDHCMLCGKCLLVCPRGVNIRALIMNMRKLVNCKGVNSELTNGFVSSYYRSQTTANIKKR